MNLERQKEPFSLQLRVYLQWPHEIRWGVLSDLQRRRQGARRVQPSAVKKDTHPCEKQKQHRCE